MPRRILVIANPQSGNGRTRRLLDELARRLREALGPLEIECTRGPRDAERLAREGVRAGVERLVVVGGDGTLAEVATGLLGAGLAGYAEIGLVPIGTGGDFARGLGLPRDVDAAIRTLVTGKARPLDAGKVAFLDPAGRPATAYFANVASLGISGGVVEGVNRGRKALGGRLAFLGATLRAIARYRPREVALRVDGELVHAAPLTLAAAANGSFFGAGMRIAPGARSDDGLLDLVTVSGLSRAQLLRKLPKLYRGDHLADPAVGLRRGRRIEADAEPGSVPLELDGDFVGALPARLEVVPGALAVVGPAA